MVRLSGEAQIRPAHQVATPDIVPVFTPVFVELTSNKRTTVAFRQFEFQPYSIR